MAATTSTAVDRPHRLLLLPTAAAVSSRHDACGSWGCGWEWGGWFWWTIWMERSLPIFHAPPRPRLLVAYSPTSARPPVIRRRCWRDEDRRHFEGLDAELIIRGERHEAYLLEHLQRHHGRMPEPQGDYDVFADANVLGAKHCYFAQSSWHYHIFFFFFLKYIHMGVPEGMDLDPNQNFVDPYMALINLKRPGSEWERMRTYMIPLIARSSLLWCKTGYVQTQLHICHSFYFLWMIFYCHWLARYLEYRPAVNLNNRRFGIG
jgi:hypothetical protein